MLAETNQGYRNSGVAMLVSLHCLEEATVVDTGNAKDTIASFRSMKGSVEALRHSADAAVLLVASMGPRACGIAYVNSVKSGNTVSVATKACALGYFTFGHELAHNMGAQHNREAGAVNLAHPWGHGHLIAGGGESSGQRTIMAYSSPGHTRRVNYYSNPWVVLPQTGTPTGKLLANNAAVLSTARAALARLGDQAVCCACQRPVHSLQEKPKPFPFITGIVADVAAKVHDLFSKINPFG